MTRVKSDHVFATLHLTATPSPTTTSDLLALKFMRLRDTNGRGFTSSSTASICLPHQHQRWPCCICVKLFLAFKLEKGHFQKRSFSMARHHKKNKQGKKGVSGIKCD